MKIKLSKKQWELVGKQAGWTKTAQTFNSIPTGSTGPISRHLEFDEHWENLQKVINNVLNESHRDASKNKLELQGAINRAKASLDGLMNLTRSMEAPHPPE